MAWTSKIQFEDILKRELVVDKNNEPLRDKNNNCIFTSDKTQVVIYIEGISGRYVEEESRKNDESYFSFHIVPYNRQRNFLEYYIGHIVNVVALKDDIHRIETNSKPKYRLDRLNELVELITHYLNNDTYKEIFLLGLSHGSLIVQMALVNVMKDFKNQDSKLKKLRFYAISPPFPLINLLVQETFIKPLAQSESTLDNKLGLTVSKKLLVPLKSTLFKKTSLPQKRVLPFVKKSLLPPCYAPFDFKDISINQNDLIIHKKTKPPTFLQIHFENDGYYNKFSFIIKFLLGKICENFKTYLSEIKSVKSKSEEWNKNELGPNGLIFFNKKESVLMVMDSKNNDISNTHDFCKSLLQKHYSPLYEDMHRFYILYNNSLCHASILLLFAITYLDINTAIMKVPFNGGQAKDKIYILGKNRKIYKKSRWSYIKYKGEFITIQKAKSMSLNRKI